MFCQSTSIARIALSPEPWKGYGFTGPFEGTLAPATSPAFRHKKSPSAEAKGQHLKSIMQKILFQGDGLSVVFYLRGGEGYEIVCGG
jgi:hypothetical protein